MQVARTTARRAILVAAMLGAAAPLVGCAKGSRPDGAVSEIDEQEQSFLQERIQKGIAESPVK